MRKLIIAAAAFTAIAATPALARDYVAIEIDPDHLYFVRALDLSSITPLEGNMKEATELLILQGKEKRGAKTAMRVQFRTRLDCDARRYVHLRMDVFLDESVTPVSTDDTAADAADPAKWKVIDPDGPTERTRRLVCDGDAPNPGRLFHAENDIEFQLQMVKLYATWQPMK